MNEILKTLFAFSFLSLALTPSAHAISGIGDSLGMSPFWSYKTIETEHFRINFPVELTDTAQKTANYLEEAHRILSPALYWEASYHVNVNIIDNMDLENGLTSATLRFGMTLFVTPPDNWLSIAYYDNWLRELCIHEYTHFLNMDATRGFYRVLRYLLGDLILPNSLWPTWMLEGLAVYDETRYTGGGRGRSPYYDMVLRASVLENVLDTRDFITLDKVNGPNPYYPGGETPYLFGYELMNEISQGVKPGRTADHKDALQSGDDALGIMSKRSSRRFPFFINGNLENITDRDWYSAWDDFVRKSRAHADTQLETIRSESVTAFRKLTARSFEAYGPRLSPDGKWIAYTLDGLDDISGLYLMERESGKTRRMIDKSAGLSLAFTNDSKFVFESRLHRIRTYYLYSDIEVMDVDSGSTYWLTWDRRAKDPSVSPDEKWITFTETRNSTTQLVLGELKREGDRFVLGDTRVLFAGKRYDRVATPQFSPDGNRIAFSLHANGEENEDIYVFDLKENSATLIVHDPSLKRYPAWDPQGNLYYVSDVTGVDNLFRHKFGQVSNFETGVAFPSFSSQLPKGKYLASVFSTSGWDVAEVDLAVRPYPSKKLTVEPPTIPAHDEKSVDHVGDKTYPVDSYSIWPTILPRTWAPILGGTSQGAYLGGEIVGFDQVDRNRYVLLGAYDTFVNKGDVYAIYDNRYFGPTLEGSAYLYTSAEASNGNTLVAYARTQTYTLAAYYTFLWTYSSLTPRISYNFSRQLNYAINPAGGPDINTGATQLVQQPDATLSYSDVESSRLAVVPESGRTSLLGERVYLNSGENIFKGLAIDNENFALGTSHIVFAPSIKGSWVSHVSSYQPANVLVQGRFSNQLVNSIASNGFDRLGIHGYPLKAFYTQAATVGTASIKFPIWRILAGPGTAPLFLQNLWGFGFAETTYFPAKDQAVPSLPSAGGGIHLLVDIAQFLPLDLAVEYDKGFRDNVGGTGEVFFQLGLNALIY